MASFNKIILVGNLTRDPEMRYTPQGTALAQGGIAVNRKWKSEDGVAHEEVTFVDFTVWGKGAETFCRYTAKGLQVMLEGRLKLDQWDDKQTSAKRSKLSVVVESFQFLEFKADAPNEPSQQRGQAAATAPQPDAPEEDSVPF